MTMKKSWIALAALGFSVPALAQVAQSVAPFRDDDPFIFCPQGYETTVAAECWVPVTPYTTRVYAYTGFCDPPNEDGRPWTDRDYQALSLYMTVCPQALKSGSWAGPGTGAESPYAH